MGVSTGAGGAADGGLGAEERPDLEVEERSDPGPRGRADGMERDSAEAPGIFLFDTTHHALWAEEVARELAVPVEVIPAPPETGAKCDLAIRTLAERVDELVRAYRDEGITFKLYL